MGLLLSRPRCAGELLHRAAHDHWKPCPGALSLRQEPEASSSPWLGGGGVLCCLAFLIFSLYVTCPHSKALRVFSLSSAWKAAVKALSPRGPEVGHASGVNRAWQNFPSLLLLGTRQGDLGTHWGSSHLSTYRKGTPAPGCLALFPRQQRPGCRWTAGWMPRQGQGWEPAVLVGRQEALGVPPPLG